MSGPTPAARGGSFNHRSEYHRAWSRLTPPVVPNAEVVTALTEQIADAGERTLLLGVTPQFAGIGGQLVAVDRNFSMVLNIWPGNNAARCAIVSDWQCMAFPADTFSACIGDGSLTALRSPDQHERLFAELGRVLRPAARFVCRLFAPPDVGETIAAVREATLSGGIRNFHAFKWRLAMALALEKADANVPVRDVFAAFNRMFGDRDELVRITGWNREHIDTIDFYEHSISAFSFASRRQLAEAASQTFSGVRFVPSGTYELAERCPLLVMQRR